jgi:cytochrome c
MQMPRIVLNCFVLVLLATLFGCQPSEDKNDRKAASSAVTVAQDGRKDQAGPTATMSAEAVKLAKDIGCFACHSVEKKFLGPSWKNVAAMYRLDPVGEDKLLAKIAKGGSGAWGQIEMPAYPNVSEADRRVLVRSILSLE